MDNRIKLAVYKSLELEKQRSAKIDLSFVATKVHNCKTRFVHESCLNNLILDIEQSMYLIQTQIASLILDVIAKYHIDIVPIRWWFTIRDIMLGYTLLDPGEESELGLLMPEENYVLFLRDHKINNLEIKMGEIKKLGQGQITNAILDELDKRGDALKRSELHKYLRQWYEKDL
jgi:hypothetical protein